MARTVVPEVPSGAPLPAPAVARAPYPLAVDYLGAAALLLGGLPTRRMLVAWIGLAALAVIAALTLFSHGLPLVPIAGLLLILLGVVQVLERGPRPG
jgi:hypothetical protein